MSKETQAETPGELDTSARHAPSQAEETCCPVIELRQYLHYPGRRDEFIALFDEYFIEGQEHYGVFIPGHFRDRTNPDRFVWLRGFANMQTRQTALHDFYHVSPLWMWGASLEEALEMLSTRHSLLRHRAEEQETRKGCGE